MTKSQIDVHVHGYSTRHGQGGWGAVLINKTKAKYKAEYGGAIRYASDDQMEIMAAIHALGYIKKPCIVTLHTGSKLLSRIFKENYLPKDFKNLALELRYYASVHDITIEDSTRCDECGKVRKLVHEGIQDAKEKYRLNKGRFDRVPNHF